MWRTLHSTPPVDAMVWEWSPHVQCKLYKSKLRKQYLYRVQNVKYIYLPIYLHGVGVVIERSVFPLWFWQHRVVNWTTQWLIWGFDRRLRLAWKITSLSILKYLVRKTCTTHNKQLHSQRSPPVRHRLLIWYSHLTSTCGRTLHSTPPVDAMVWGWSPHVQCKLYKSKVENVKHDILPIYNLHGVVVFYERSVFPLESDSIILSTDNAVGNMRFW